MADKVNRTAKTLADNEAEIVDAWIEGQRTESRIRGNLFGDQKELRQQSREFVHELVAATQSGNLENVNAPEFEPVRRVAAAIMDRREQAGFSPFENAVAIICLKDFWSSHVQTQYRTEPELLKRELVVVAKLVDSSAILALEYAVKRREKTIAQQTTAILEMSTPVVQIWDGVLVVPLIGTLDTARAQRLTENLLQRIVATGSPIALIDITGVPAIDTKSAQHLIETVSAVRLLGGTVILTGIRPAIAQTLVHLGIDLKSVLTRPSLASGLRHAMDNLNITVTARSSGS